MNYIILCSSIFILVPFIFLPFTSCDLMLIDTTCKRTPNPNLCISILRPNPKSQGADITGLSLILVDAVKGKVETILQVINKLEKSKMPPRLKKGLDECRERHDTILTADVVEAIEALQKGDPKFAVDGMNDAAIEAQICEDSYKPKGGSPLSKLNKDINDTSLVASAVIRNLL